MSAKRRAKSTTSTSAVSTSEVLALKVLSPHVAELLKITQTTAKKAGLSWRSLAPSKDAASLLVDIARSVLGKVVLAEQQEIAWAMAMSDLVRAITKNFPENIFCDLDYIGRVLADVTLREGHVALERRIDPLVRLHRAYGRHTVIRFRYVHDFLYGYDWARWVQQNLPARDAIRPFDGAFLARSEARAEELKLLVEKNDAKYPALPDGSLRNPFGFDREPAAEVALLVSLAKDGLIPVRAWEELPTFDLRPAYSVLREERARALGLVRKS